ncbi:MAG: 4Fe-4S dicluster domain-containing protein [Planctomycetota bacterium]
MTTYCLDPQQLADALAEKEGIVTFAPVPTEGMSWLGIGVAEPDPSALREPRSAQSPKGAVFPASESVGRYGPKAGTATDTLPKSIVLVGVRACELRAIRYLDRVLLEGDFEDPPYRRRREATTLVACDCTGLAETCACTLVGGQPYPNEGYDVNLTPLDDRFLVEVATPKGEAWLESVGLTDLAEAGEDELARRDEQRAEVARRVEEQNAEFEVRASDDTPAPLPDDAAESWNRFAADCVECGACTHICPTCHCFYLYDQALGPEEFERLKTWDSCLWSTYHRMAGGAGMKLSPRPRLASRLANRVLHKFVYSPQQYELLGCVGCGRCVDACPGAIDIREVVRELAE